MRRILKRRLPFFPCLPSAVASLFLKGKSKEIKAVAAVSSKLFLGSQPRSSFCHCQVKIAIIFFLLFFTQLQRSVKIIDNDKAEDGEKYSILDQDKHPFVDRSTLFRPALGTKVEKEANLAMT